MSFQQEIRQTDVVFKGKILTKKEISLYHSFNARIEEVSYNILVLHTYKGRLHEDTVTLITDKPYPGNFAVNLEIGEAYLLYARYEINAYLAPESGCRLFTDKCTRTARFSEADQQELQLLRKLDRPIEAKSTEPAQGTVSMRDMLWVILTNLLLVGWIMWLRKRKQQK